MKKFKIAIVGATGAVGREMLRCVFQFNFPFESIKLLASARSAGKEIEFEGHKFVVEELTENSFEGVEVAFWSAGGSISEKYMKYAVEAGCVNIDNTSHFRMDPNVPLVVPVHRRGPHQRCAGAPYLRLSGGGRRGRGAPLGRGACAVHRLGRLRLRPQSLPHRGLCAPRGRPRCGGRRLPARDRRRHTRAGGRLRRPQSAQAAGEVSKPDAGAELRPRPFATLAGAPKPAPAVTSRNLSARTRAMACSLAASSPLIGICAAMPPIACAPRWWQVWISSSE